MASIDITKLTTATLGVSLSDTQASPAQPSVVFTWQIQRGRAAVIPGEFKPIWKFKDSSGNELPDLTEIYFGIIVPSDVRRVKHFGSRIIYRPWKQLSVSEMYDTRFQAALRVDLGLPYLALGPQDKFVIMLYSSTVCDAGTNGSHITIDIPYFERKPGEIGAELDVRQQALGV